MNRDFATTATGDEEPAPASSLTWACSRGLPRPRTRLLGPMTYARSSPRASRACPRPTSTPAARDYLDINCAHCHNPAAACNGISEPALPQPRQRRPPSTWACARSPARPAKAPAGFVYDIVPGDADDASILVFRMETDRAGGDDAAARPLPRARARSRPGAALDRRDAARRLRIGPRRAPWRDPARPSGRRVPGRWGSRRPRFVAAPAFCGRGDRIGRGPRS